MVLSQRIKAHGQSKPLIVVLDNGSTPEDAFAFKLLKSMDYESIVVDHHNPGELKKGKTVVCDYLSLHLNPYIFGFDSQTSAGMLCYELARFINEDYENDSLPAVAAISDRCQIKETEDYIKLSKKTREDLGKIGIAVDFMAYNLKFAGGEGVIDDLYSNPKFVELINEQVRKGVETQLQSTLPYLRTIEINGVLFSYIDLEKYTLRFTYPTPGKILGLIHDSVAKEGENTALTLGYMSDMIIIRANKPVLPVSKIIEAISKKLPQANVDGGGHEQAGTIKFVPAHLESIIGIIKDELKEATKIE
jgi:RecJ-like exonuclease